MCTYLVFMKHPLALVSPVSARPHANALHLVSATHLSSHCWRVEKKKPQQPEPWFCATRFSTHAIVPAALLTGAVVVWADNVVVVVVTVDVELHVQPSSRSPLSCLSLETKV